MDTMDMCHICHLLSLVILSLHLYNHAIIFLGSINTHSVLCMLVPLLYSIAIFCFCLLLFSKEYFPETITLVAAVGLLRLGGSNAESLFARRRLQLWCRRFEAYALSVMLLKEQLCDALLALLDDAAFRAFDLLGLSEMTSQDYKLLVEALTK